MMENPVQVIWVRWMAMGRNIRKAPHLPFALSKRMAHQLTTADALIDEGIDMHHCVASYAQRCHQGKCSIWSLRQYEADGHLQRLVTIELDQQGRVAQARRAYNAMPKEEEMEMVRRWVAGCGSCHGRDYCGACGVLSGLG